MSYAVFRGQGFPESPIFLLRPLLSFDACPAAGRYITVSAPFDR